MLKGSDILKIVKEDILRILGERKEKVSLESIEAEIKASNSFVSKAIEDLEKENLILIEKNLVGLTKIGRDEAKDIVEKHLVFENYFKRTKNEEEAHKAAHIIEHYVSEEVIKNIKGLSTFKERGIPLIEFKLDKELLIADIAIPDNEQFERIVSMGIFPGEEIKIISEIPNGIIVKIKNKKFFLDKDLAKGIKVLEYEKA